MQQCWSENLYTSEKSFTDCGLRNHTLVHRAYDETESPSIFNGTDLLAIEVKTKYHHEKAKTRNNSFCTDINIQRRAPYFMPQMFCLSEQSLSRSRLNKTMMRRYNTIKSFITGAWSAGGPNLRPIS